MRHSIRWRWVVAGLFVAGNAAPARAQQACLPDSVVDYLDVDFVKVQTPRNAYFTRVKHFTSAGGGVWHTYYPGGQERSAVTYGNFHKLKLQGSALDRYPSGRVKLQYVADDGVIDGYLQSFYPDGTPKRKDLYDHGRLVKGQYSDPEGQLVEPYVSFQQNPAFPGGAAALTAAIQQNLAYPPDAVRSAAEGQVMVSFLVTARGDVTEVLVKQPNNPLLDAAAVAAVRQLPPFEPGRIDGERMPINMMVPITFKASPTMKTLKRWGF